jgi:hypothetical protein
MNMDIRWLIENLTKTEAPQFLIESRYVDGSYINRILRISGDGFLYPVATDDWFSEGNAAGDILLTIDDLTRYGFEVVVDACEDVEYCLDF